MTELATIDGDTGELVAARSANLLGTQEPTAFIERAAQHAQALAQVIRDQHLYKTIGQKNFVFVEGWTLLGSMLGVFPVMEQVEQVDLDGVTGWKATVSAQTRAGEVVGRATALCLRSEKTWASRDEYAVCSMAQTRAVSKALRQPLGFIVTLAGYSATPAEEIPQEERQGSPGNPSPAAPREGADLATKLQHSKLNAMLKDLQERHPTTDQESWLNALKRWAKDLGFPASRKDWTIPQMSAAIEHVNAWAADEELPF